MKRRCFFVLVNLLWIAVIFILCVMPGEDMPELEWKVPHLDKAVHFGMYFILSILLVFPLEKYTGLKTKWIYVIAVLAAFLYGGAIEVLQANFFNRSGDVWDLSADVLGGVAGCLCYPWVKKAISAKM